MPLFIDVKIISQLAFDPGLICLKHIWSSLLLNCWYSKEKFSSNSTVLCKSNESEFIEFQRNLPKLWDISKRAKSNFCWYFDAPIFPMSLKFCMTFCSRDNEILLGKVKFRERNFVHHFVSGSEILWNISFVGIEIKLNVDEINKNFA